MVKIQKPHKKPRLIIIFLVMFVFCACCSSFNSFATNKNKSVEINGNEDRLEETLPKNTQSELLNPDENKAKSGGIERNEPKFVETLLPTETPGESQSPVQTATSTKAPTQIATATITKTKAPTRTATARITKTIAPTKTETPVPPETALPEVIVFACPQGCTEQKPGCDIKGNISVNSKEKIYHIPGQQNYEQTVISPEKGERWFCTEDEAVANGWRKAMR
ncbi:MAG: hypothetical protein KBA03_02235 [Anaerolineaceae bacterium]|nr:hypothetical protein [Anaerolineaceae bacterium]